MRAGVRIRADAVSPPAPISTSSANTFLKPLVAAHVNALYLVQRGGQSSPRWSPDCHAPILVDRQVVRARVN